ncbi:hypothetical protein PLAN_60242 [Planktothrix rubescens CCAP 1459/22]|uniref:Uncharacterized protein n=1 Tax=Planktothrix rubescens CCAP 1459/22 TaxID=329571 RepID=A0A6J7ZNA1_PLARU|nr:hypothetical protein PLAN_60242 [Planktothrix rubescens NIVA-CYA 18]
MRKGYNYQDINYYLEVIFTLAVPQFRYIILGFRMICTIT